VRYSGQGELISQEEESLTDDRSTKDQERFNGGSSEEVLYIPAYIGRHDGQGSRQPASVSSVASKLSKQPFMGMLSILHLPKVAINSLDVSMLSGPP
jgi:hypothetical protein